MVHKMLTDISCLEKCEPATEADLILFMDMYETARAFKNEYGDFAANQIGINKRVFVLYFVGEPFVFINPEILKKERPYETGQTCMYYKATRTVTRYESIKIRYYNSKFDELEMTIEGKYAEHFQHMMDHIDGKHI